ncbi:Zn-ribbon domain-containing OB-fold protein [Pseudonocardia kujensis]|uniref:Zn-ribbon domain-containing OB-fold protein n=1 Tax=Pseudonocardia kujensis TaxID=1128675 RepID=UPI001E354003|nr:Zn-ribbon domain-containing OB-fold protein [Pseudonocardia kujensis]MCE0764235.1 Zn-ribbon domain-containing OB-fold protein [Pseudonocardia kujensis]
MPREPRPFREGLLSLDPPRLLGSRCPACTVTSFPARDFCPGCRAAEGVERAELSTEGRVHSFTVVRQAPPGVEVPYVLAWVDLPADDVRLMAQVVGTAPEEVALDMPVQLELTPFGDADEGLLGFRFRAGVAA